MLGKRDINQRVMLSIDDNEAEIMHALDRLRGGKAEPVRQAADQLSRLLDRRECPHWQHSTEVVVHLGGVDSMLQLLFKKISVLSVLMILQRLMWHPDARRALVRSNNGRCFELLISYMDCIEVYEPDKRVTPNLNELSGQHTMQQSDIQRVAGWILAELATDHGAQILLQNCLKAIFLAAERNGPEAKATAAWACALLSAKCDHALPLLKHNAVRMALQIALESKGVSRQHAVFSLANLAAQTWLHKMLVENVDLVGNVMDMLLDAAAELDDATKRQALRVLSNMALSAENAGRILELDPENQLLKMLHCSTPDIQRQVLRLVVNISSKKKLAREVVTRTDVSALASLLNSAQMEIQQDAVRALCNILDSSAAEEALDAAQLAEVLPRLVALVGHDGASPEVQRIASMALSNVSCHQNRVAVIGLGGLKALIDAHRTSACEEVCEASGAALSSLGRALTPASRRAYLSLLSSPRNPKLKRRASPLSLFSKTAAVG